MISNWRHTDLPDLVSTLVRRPGHESLRTLLADLLRNAFGADYAALDHEVRMPEVRGRADVLFGATVFELKSDLRRELGDVEARLPDYLAERERLTGRRFLGIATDGATFAAFELRDGALANVSGPPVVYTKAGTLLSAAIVEDANIVIDHKAYWTETLSLDEARSRPRTTRRALHHARSMHIFSA